MLNRFPGVLDWFRPHQVVSCLEDINCETLLTRGLQGVMLDLDNTLAAWRSQEISPEVEAWLAGLRQTGLQCCMVTNSFNIWRVRPVARRLGLKCVAGAVKPLPLGFLRGMRHMKTSPENTAMVGDLLTMDICGGNSLGLFTVLVEPRSPHDAWFTRYLQRPVEKWIGRIPRARK
jgi:uncharacterized protein